MKCRICGHEVEGFGNNPYPVRTGEDDRCCNDCNDMFVIPARIAMLGMDEDMKENVPKYLNKACFGELVEIFCGGKE